MEYWYLPTAAVATRKKVERAPGSDAPRVEVDGPAMPQVLFTSPDCRAIIVELAAGELMDDHKVHERAIVQVVTGHAEVKTAEETIDCPAGSLIHFDPLETHSVRAHELTRLLLILAPWPAKRTSRGADHLPKNAVAPPAN